MKTAPETYLPCMTATHTEPKKRFAREGRVPVYARITPELKALLTQIAKQEDMSVTELASLAVEQWVNSTKHRPR
jgi:predicted HicB family RNase H-like nuclease